MGRPREPVRHDERRRNDDGFRVLVLVLLVLALVAVLANLYLHLSPRRGDVVASAGAAEPEARRLLDRRLALGEISPEEYASVRTALEA